MGLVDEESALADILAETTTVTVNLLGWDQRALAERLTGRLRSGANFAQLARQHSQDPRAKSSDARIEIEKGDTSAAYERVVFSIPKGKVAGPIRTQFGWHIIEALGPVKRGKTFTFAEVKEHLASRGIPVRL